MRGVSGWNETESATWGSFGVVLGATLNLKSFELPEPGSKTLPILAPGFGEQGAQVAELAQIFEHYARGVIVSESRSLLERGADALAHAIERRRDEIVEVYG